jgi:hypothetical protein
MRKKIIATLLIMGLIMGMFAVIGIIFGGSMSEVLAVCGVMLVSMVSMLLFVAIMIKIILWACD